MKRKSKEKPEKTLAMSTILAHFSNEDLIAHVFRNVMIESEDLEEQISDYLDELGNIRMPRYYVNRLRKQISQCKKRNAKLSEALGHLNMLTKILK